MAEFYKNELPGWNEKAANIMSMMGLSKSVSFDMSHVSI